MLTLIAFAAAQAATLSNQTAEDAMRCGASAIVTGLASSESQLRLTSHFMYFVMQAAKADPGNKPFLLRVGELASSIDLSKVPTPEAASTLIADCDRTYPMARATATPRLPTDAFDRDVLCMGVLSLLRGAAEEIRQADPGADLEQRIDAVLGPIGSRLDDEALAKRGMADEDAFMAAMGDQLQASLTLGHPETVARACGVAGL